MRAIRNIDSESANTSLTRRAALGGLAVLAVASPALAVAPGFEGPDPVIRLCDAWLELHDHFSERMRRHREITERVHASMPPPDPSIIYGPESEKLRIKTPEYFGWWRPPHNVIEPNAIETALFYVRPLKMTMSESINAEGRIARTFVEYDEPLPLTEWQQATHDKLTRMLELSKEYFAEIERRKVAAGYEDDDDHQDWVDETADRQLVIERAIRIKRATTREGLLAKIDLYDSMGRYDENPELVQSIFRDVRRLLANLDGVA